jgi:site-specific DNA recombinase
MFAIYTRLSKEDEASNSISNQLREGEQYRILNGIKKVEIYDEGEGLTGTKGSKDRPELARLIKDIAEGAITSVWMRKQDRLARSGLIVLTFADVARKLGVKLIFGDKGEIDLNDPIQYFQLTIMSAVDELKPHQQSVDTKRALHANLKEGKVHAVIPYGYAKDKKNHKMIIDEEEAKTVKLIFKLSLEGNGYRSISKELNKRKILTRYNKIGKGAKKNGKWADGTICGIIKNKVYKGIREFGGEVYEVDPIFEPYYFDKVNNNLVNNMTGGKKETIHPYLLNGVNVCGVCGKPFNGRALSNKYVLYQCVTRRNGKESCGNLGVRLNNVNNLIWNLYFKDKFMLDLINIEYKSTNDIIIASDAMLEAGEYDRRKKELIKEKKNLVLAIAKGILKQKDIREVLDDIETESNEASIKIDELMTLAFKHQDILENHIIKTKELEDFDIIETFEDKKAIIQKYIKEIVITKLPKQHTKIYVHFIAPNIQSDILIIDRNYNWVCEPNRMRITPLKGVEIDGKLDIEIHNEIHKMFEKFKDLYVN